MISNTTADLRQAFQPSDAATREDAEHRGRVAVLSITYEKLPDRNTQFSDRLEVITAPLCLTFVPGLIDKLKRFFQTPPEGACDF